MTDIEVAPAPVAKRRPSRQEVKDALLADLPKLQAICSEAFGSDSAAHLLRQALTEMACYMIGYSAATTTKPARRSAEVALKAAKKLLQFLDESPPDGLAELLSQAPEQEKAEIGKVRLRLHSYRHAQQLRSYLASFILGSEAVQLRQPPGTKGRPERFDPIEFLTENCLALWDKFAKSPPTSSTKMGGFGAFAKHSADLAVAAAGGEIFGYCPDTMRNSVKQQLSKRPRRKRQIIKNCPP